ncbi:hypothetical protein QCK43_001435 [Enterobacter cancerogenus]|nr:hypothetical protein [Enterobacter cancerogenus]
MSTITREQVKVLRNAFQCWQQDYDPVEDKEQYDMFGLGMVAMDALLASLEADPVAYTEKCEITNMQATGLYLRGFPDNSQGRDIALYTAPPAPVLLNGWVLVPVDMPHEMMRAVQVNSELGAYAATNLNGAYSLFREFWDVAVTAAPQQEMNT